MKDLVIIGAGNAGNLNAFLTRALHYIPKYSILEADPGGLTEAVPWKLERDTSGEQALYSDSTRDLITTKSGFTYPEPKRRRR